MPRALPVLWGVLCSPNCSPTARLGAAAGTPTPLVRAAARPGSALGTPLPGENIDVTISTSDYQHTTAYSTPGFPLPTESAVIDPVCGRLYSRCTLPAVKIERARSRAMTGEIGRQCRSQLIARTVGRPHVVQVRPIPPDIGHYRI